MGFVCLCAWEDRFAMRNRCFDRFLLVGVVCFSATLPAPEMARAQSMRERFFMETKEKWEVYGRLSVGLQEESEVSSRVINTQQGFGAGEQAQTKRDRAGKHLLLMTEGNDPKLGHTCYVKNERYAFGLRRKERSAPWVMTELFTDLNSADCKAFIRNPLYDGNFTARGPFALYNESIENVVKDPNFQIKEIESFQRDGLSLVKIHFINQQPDFKPKGFRVSLYESGWAVFCPDQYWRLCEFEAAVLQFGGHRFTVRGTLECKVDAKGFPIFTGSLVRWKGRSPLDGKDYESEIKTKSTIEERDPSPDEFTLTAFGLPEPMGMPPVNRGGSRWWFWITLAAAGSLALALLYQKLKRRFEKPAFVSK